MDAELNSGSGNDPIRHEDSMPLATGPGDHDNLRSETASAGTCPTACDRLGDGAVIMSDYAGDNESLRATTGTVAEAPGASAASSLFKAATH